MCIPTYRVYCVGGGRRTRPAPPERAHDPPGRPHSSTTAPRVSVALAATVGAYRGARTRYSHLQYLAVAASGVGSPRGGAGC